MGTAIKSFLGGSW